MRTSKRIRLIIYVSSDTLSWYVILVKFKINFTQDFFFFLHLTVFKKKDVLKWMCYITIFSFSMRTSTLETILTYYFMFLNTLANPFKCAIWTQWKVLSSYPLTLVSWHHFRFWISGMDFPSLCSCLIHSCIFLLAFSFIEPYTCLKNISNCLLRE